MTVAEKYFQIKNLFIYIYMKGKPIILFIIIVVVFSFINNQITKIANGQSETGPLVIGLPINLAKMPRLVLAREPSDGKVAWGDIDRDGDLDLAVGYRVYLNSGDKLDQNPVWKIDARRGGSPAWGDLNNDGFLDLAVDSNVFLNNGGTLQTSAIWSTVDSTAAAWADVDSDSDFDLVISVAPTWQLDCQCLLGSMNLYLNDGNRLQTSPVWSVVDTTANFAWGDVNDDGRLDLATSNKLYLNIGGSLQITPTWSISGPNYASVAWGDVDNDNDIDLAIGAKVFINEKGNLLDIPIWEVAEGGGIPSWLDIDIDGDLDLLVDTKLYLNDHGLLQKTPVWESEAEGSRSTAWGDIDNDGDLDLATVGAASGFVKLYINEGSLLENYASWTSGETFAASVTAMAWGDVENDGASDLVVGGDFEYSLLFRNENHELAKFPSWYSSENNSTDGIDGVAWGDVDGDGDLDLAVANDDGPIELYINNHGTLESSPFWSANDETSANAIAWGDIDNDGDLDLASCSSLISVYLNENGGISLNADWVSDNFNSNFDIAWGDIDGDSDLDLVVGTLVSIEIYINSFGQLSKAPESIPVDGALRSIALGDVDGDSDPDLAVGNVLGPVKLYSNEKGTLQTEPIWVSSDANTSLDVTWVDIDGDADLDLVASGDSIRIYTNNSGTLQSTSVWLLPRTTNTSNVAMSDADGDGDYDLAIGSDNMAKVYYNRTVAHTILPKKNGQSSVVIYPYSTKIPTFNGLSSTALAPANFYAIPGIRQSATIPITYTLFNPQSKPVSAIRVYYSLDGSFSGERRNWRVAMATSDTQITDLGTSPYPTRTVTNTHVFHWDVWNSGFFGQSDNVVLRIEALPSFKPTPNDVPGPYLYSYVSTQSFPFRVRGVQVRTVHAGSQQTLARQAIIYQLPAQQTQNATPFTANSGKVLYTDQFGYLQGRGRLEPGDRLFALAPITATDKYTVYHTNGVVTPTGLEGYTVQTGGIQTITVSAANTLILYNLTVSLEWDARNDPTFMAQLENDLRRTSQILFDLTNGQAALGDVRIYHDKGFWGTADVVIAASNNQRPNAILGGSVLTPTADVDIHGNAIPDAYVPGQVRMGATWNRFGNPNGTLGEDWPRTLAHELGHYLFFVPDNYIGVTPDRQFVQIVDCQGSVMTDPYEESYSEFLTAEQWQTDACQRSVAAVYLGRPDWATITRFYPMLNGRGGNAGPAQLPLAVTRITTFAPPRPATTLAAPFFPLVNQQGQTISVPDGRGQAYLFKTGSNADPTDDYLIALGTPIGDLVQARGAAPGDRLCVFDYASQPLRLGCQATVGNAPSSITLAEVADWAPQIQVRGLTTNTVIVTVTNVSADNLAVQLLPALGVASPELPMTRQGNAFVQTVTAADGAYFGFIRIWVPGSNPLKELIVEYSATESWDGRARAWGTTADAWGGRARAWGGRAYGWGGRARAWGAPVMSSDGQVSIFPLDNPFANGAQYTLQSVAFPPALPAWLTAVGQAYRIASTGALVQSAILFSYLGRDVPDGYENFLTIYYSPDEGRSWQRLPTDLDTNRNQASAPVRGTGIYLLAATVPSNPTLAAGWNNLGYPVQRTQLITEALASVAGKYSVVYTYQAAPAPAWQTFAPDVPAPFAALVNDLRQMELGHAYWIYATAATDLFWGVGPAVTASQVAAAASAPAAPASYYGWIASDATFAPAVGMRVTATIDGVVCGETTVQLVNGQLGYVIRVAANDPQDALPTCGGAGKALTFTVGDQPMAQTASWNNQAVQFLALGQTVGVNAVPVQPNQLYLPLVRK